MDDGLNNNQRTFLGFDLSTQQVKGGEDVTQTWTHSKARRHF